MNPWEVVRVPFETVRRGYWQARKALFTSPRPPGTYLLADATVAELRATLGRESYAPNWEFSYYERGEDLNQARVVYTAGRRR